jgi:7-cyano-7-deazaguanine synthase in queuosine biosynthesis
VEQAELILTLHFDYYQRQLKRPEIVVGYKPEDRNVQIVVFRLDFDNAWEQTTLVNQEVQ